MSKDSIINQARIESEDVLSFDDFLKHYFDQTLGQQMPYVNK